MSDTSILSVLLVCGLLGMSMGDIFEELDLQSTKSPYSVGTSGVGYSNPFSCSCGTNTLCWLPYGNDTKECSCKDGYIGTPPNCKPGPELWDLCFKGNPCGLYSQCEVLNGTRNCPYCDPYYEGTPPNCRLPNKCRDVTAFCGHNAECYPSYFELCKCVRGFVGNPPNCTPGPELLALCNPYPCGPHSDCRVENGGPVCSCSRGYLGAPPNCKPGPEMWRVCFKDQPCGEHSKCDVIDRVAVCSPCDKGYSGEPPHCYQSSVLSFT